MQLVPVFVGAILCYFASLPTAFGHCIGRPWCGQHYKVISKPIALKYPQISYPYMAPNPTQVVPIVRKPHCICKSIPTSPSHTTYPHITYNHIQSHTPRGCYTCRGPVPSGHEQCNDCAQKIIINKPGPSFSEVEIEQVPEPEYGIPQQGCGKCHKCIKQCGQCDWI